MTRTVKLKLLTQKNLVKVETSVRTFAEFKKDPEIEKLNIDWDQTKLIDKDTKRSIELEEAALPAGDCLLFIMPTKSKSGTDLPYKEVREKIREYKENGGNVPFNYTHATTKELNEFWKQVAPKAKKTIASFKAVEVKPSVKQALSSTKEEVSFIEPTLKVSELVDTTTLTDLSKEAESIKKQLK